MRRATSGFTLVEMLVAVTILALLGVMGWRGLDQLIGLRTRVNDDTADIERIVRVFSQIEFDVAQRIPDSLVDGSLGPAQALPRAMELGIGPDDLPRMRVMRARPDGLETVWAGYSLESGTLVRTAVPAFSTAAGDRVVLLERVGRFELRVLRTDAWMSAKDYLLLGLGGGPVSALEVSIERKPGERYVRVMAL